MRAQHAVEVTGPEAFVAHRAREWWDRAERLLAAPGARLERDLDGVLRLHLPTPTTEESS